MIQAVETVKAVDGGKVMFIDVIGDKSSLDKGHLLSSVIWDMIPVYSAMIEDLRNDTFGTRGYGIGLSDNSVRLLKTPYIPADVWSDLMTMRDEIINGSLTVEEISDAQEVRELMSSVDIGEG